MNKRPLAEVRPSSHPNQLLFKKYDPVFNFFFSKAINDIVEFHPSPELYALREYCYRDSDGEFLKRYYELDEVAERVVLLAEIHHPPQTWPVEVPTLSHHVPRSFISKRLKRHKKLRQKLNEINNQQRVQLSSCFLDSAHAQGPEEDHKQQRQDPRNQSFDESVHDIYQLPDGAIEIDEGLDPRSLARLVSPTCLQQETNEINQEWVNQNAVSHLICDFDDMDMMTILNQYARLKKKEKDRENTLREKEPKGSNSLLNPSGSVISTFGKAEMKRSHVFSQRVNLLGSPERLQESLNKRGTYRNRQDSVVADLSSKRYPLAGSDGSTIEEKKTSFLSKQLYQKLARHEEKQRKPAGYRAQANMYRGEVYSPNHDLGSPTTNRNPDFDRIRKKAMELIQQQERTIPYAGNGQINSSDHTNKPWPSPRIASPPLYVPNRPNY